MFKPLPLRASARIISAGRAAFQREKKEITMLNRLTQKPLDEVMHTIQALDLESVKLRVMDPELGEGWSREYADNIEAAYKRYLVMQVKYSDDAEDILLAKDVDEFWHTHILQTRKYFDDCQSMFGNYLHHTPHVGEITQAVQEQRDRQAELTRRVYEVEFGGQEEAEAAWKGIPGSFTVAEMFEGNIRASNAAYSGSAIKSGNAAYSGSAIKSGNAAYSGSAIKSDNAAYSGSAIKAGNAAYSGSAIKPEHMPLLANHAQ
jgi:hypothetical protein